MILPTQSVGRIAEGVITSGFAVALDMPQWHPLLYRTRQHDRRLAEAEFRHSVDQLFQLGHRAHGRLHDHAGVAGDAVAFGELRNFDQFVVHLRVAMLVQAQFDDALDRQAELGHVDLGRVTGDDAAGLEFGHALGDGGGGQVHFAGKIGVGRATVFEQGAEQHAVVFVQGRTPENARLSKSRFRPSISVFSKVYRRYKQVL